MRSRPKCVLPYDVAVGKRMRFLRIAAGISQEKAAAALGLTFQQVQKYEAGTNRVAPSRLDVLAKLFGVPMSAFFDDNFSVSPKNRAADYAELLSNRSHHKIFKLLNEIDDAKLDAALLALLQRIEELATTKRRNHRIAAE